MKNNLGDRGKILERSRSRNPSRVRFLIIVIM